ncbi:MAG: hypothetical protein Q8878_04435 [Bacillota bacterium]|nr:hypothetical protein [Bacillota bacterium]
MYNRYMSSGFDELFTTVNEPSETIEEPTPLPAPKPAAIPVSATAEPAAPPKGGGLSSILDKINMPKLDMDTIIILLIVFFLLLDTTSDKGIGDILGENSDLLLIVGLLLIMGF